ncbi:hypothetical protein CDR19_02560 [Ectopseudomonas toyotomiensis]|uniref:Uncharacterized protein n=1 Tax=Ectopseudomonas toyotomiensis TaxID=554344 RepID=A0A1I5N8C6_9GAMM|nr:MULTISPECIES: hypothetical protein [Pseudomonas]PIA75068.1 hypothetical protein CDR19_02560 [Pseudomonas toyotomiensis]SDA53254.1 hypothetical protein SAMN03159475_1401 [Pseudomonas sp. NFPP33]SFP17576.1 hypothetical protein SAMN05216177_101530 [Pseudomonas toyotomiensis]
MIRAMVSLDLIDSEDERDRLYEMLAAKDWKKAIDVDTVWFLSYSQYSEQTKDSTENIKADISSTLVGAAKELKLKKIFYVAQIGNAEPIGRTIEKKHSDYASYVRTPF